MCICDQSYKILRFYNFTLRQDVNCKRTNMSSKYLRLQDSWTWASASSPWGKYWPVFHTFALEVLLINRTFMRANGVRVPLKFPGTCRHHHHVPAESRTSLAKCHLNMSMAWLSQNPKGLCIQCKVCKHWYAHIPGTCILFLYTSFEGLGAESHHCDALMQMCARWMTQ